MAEVGGRKVVEFHDGIYTGKNIEVAVGLGRLDTYVADVEVSVLEKGLHVSI